MWKIVFFIIFLPQLEYQEQGCGLCAEKCPDNAIEIKSRRPVWVKGTCSMCLGCLHRCPQFSIQFGSKTQNHGQYQNPHARI
ncbi:MAG: 4Fe-4S binding protein [Clostridiaceae bacterium]|nr:4Fe-4S binding protein [Clostridiaceae bacterium]